MEILHIIPVGGNYIIPLAEALLRHDTENKHTFMVMARFQTVLNKNPELLRIRDLRFLPIYRRQKNFRKVLFLKRCAMEADRVVWHSLSTDGGYAPFYLYAFRSLLKKSVWIPAEGEMGNYTGVHNRFLNRYVKKVNTFVQQNIGAIGITMPSDRQRLESFGITKPQTPLLRYVLQQGQYDVLALADAQPDSPVKKSCPHVQLGMSSQRANHHKKLIQTLKKLTDHETVCAFGLFRFVLRAIPYRPGTKVYMNTVRTEAQSLKCKTVFLNKTVTPQEYHSLLSRMDLVLLGHEENCQPGMLLSLLAMGKRIFLPENSPLLHSLNEMGAGIHTLEQLKELGSVEAAMELPGSCLPQVLRESFEPRQIVRQWSGCFHSGKD